MYHKLDSKWSIKMFVLVFILLRELLFEQEEVGVVAIHLQTRIALYHINGFGGSNQLISKEELDISSM